MRKPLAQRAFYWFAWWVTIGAFTAVYRYRRFNYRRIPASGPVLLVSNHQSHFDPPLLALCLPSRQFRPVARASLFKIPGFSRLIRTLNAVPLDNKTGDLAALRLAADLLGAGDVVTLFPEGSRTRDGAIGDFKRGVTVLLRQAHCVIVPCAIDGAFDAWPKHRLLPRLFSRRIAVSVGRPIDADELMELGAENALALLRAEITALHEDLAASRRGPAARRTGASRRAHRLGVAVAEHPAV